MQTATEHRIAEALDDLERPEPEIHVIEARRGWRAVDVRGVFRQREILYHLAWRDVKVRYKQTVLGVGWAVLQPLATMLVFALFLGRMGGVGSGVANYPLFVLSAVVAWTFVSNAVVGAGNSVVANERLVTKVYFERLVVPFSAVAGALADFAVAPAIVIAWAAAMHALTWPGLLLLPVVVAALVVTASGIGTLLGALIVAHRDFRYVLAFGVQLWMFATPCIYLTPEAVGPRGRLLLPLNPAYGTILAFRAVLLGLPVDWWTLLVSSGVAGLLLLAGVMYFRRVEHSFADII